MLKQTGLLLPWIIVSLAVGCASESSDLPQPAAAHPPPPSVVTPPASAQHDAGPPVDGARVDGRPAFAVADFRETVWTWDQSLDACSYSNNRIPWQWRVVGREPAGAGRYPVFIHLHGTGDVPDGPAHVAIIARMAARGYVAVSVDYDSFGGLGALLGDPTRACGLAAKKGQCLFGPGEGSAIRKICARAKADCDKGIVMAGHSQGSWLATLAKNHDARVRAVYGLGAGVHEHLALGALDVDADLSACITPSARALPAERLRVVNGEAEYVYKDLQREVRALTGMTCPAGTLECLRGDGSGFSFFPNSANETGITSAHCYFANTNNAGVAGDCAGTFAGLNTHWTAGAASYSIEPSLTWLSGFTDPPQGAAAR